MLDFDSGGQSFFNGLLFFPVLVSGCRPNHSRHDFFHVAWSRPPKESSRIRSCGDLQEGADEGLLSDPPVHPFIAPRLALPN